MEKSKTDSADGVGWVKCVLEAKTSSIVELEGGIKVSQANMKTLDSTQKRKEKTEGESSKIGKCIRARDKIPYVQN